MILSSASLDTGWLFPDLAPPLEFGDPALLDDWEGIRETDGPKTKLCTFCQNDIDAPKMWNNYYRLRAITFAIAELDEQ